MNDNNTKYYKACFCFTGGEYSSAWASGKYCLNYYIGLWTRPKTGKMFVFNDLAKAKKYAEDFGCFLFECEVENPVAAKYMSATNDYESFWKHEECPVTDVFDGTVYVDAVKLIKKI